MRTAILLPILLSLAACGSNRDGALDIVLVDSPENLTQTGLRLSTGGQYVRAATGWGLVTLDPQGEVVPALAESWIVTDDGTSFIFRLRDGTWPDGTPLTAESVRAALAQTLDELDGTSLRLDLAPIAQVRAMAGRVVELRLRSPEPALLQLLAQPELTLQKGETGAGPMVLATGEDGITLSMKPPEERGLPENEDWQDDVRMLRLTALDGGEAAAAFYDGRADIVLGGRIGNLPRIDTGPLSRGTARLDPAIGLFGLQVKRAAGPLADDGVREAIAMAIDRDALVSGFNVGGWTATTRLVPAGTPDDPGEVEERWTGADLAELRARAGGRVLEWRAAQTDGGSDVPRLSLLLPEGPGYDLLLRELAGQMATIGLELVRADDAKTADLELVDRVARFAGPRWYLNQFNCRLGRGLCSAEADALVLQALQQPDSQVRGLLLAEAEEQLTQANVYIPFGSPLRWSLVRGDVTGYANNQWAFHPLPYLAQIPR